MKLKFRNFGKSLRLYLFAVLVFSGFFVSKDVIASTTGRNNAPQAESSVYLPLVNNGVGQTKPIPTMRTVNAPYFENSNYSYTALAIFWFGQVNSVDAYADVRVGYNDFDLIISVNIIDRFLWYDVSPSFADLDNWDAVSLYISPNENPGEVLSTSETRWLAQLGNTSDRTNYQAAFRGNGMAWQNENLPFSTEVRFQGGVNGNGDGKGWSINYRIPWSSLGFSLPPPQGTMFRLGVVLHDKDTSNGPAKHEMVWPENMGAQLPDTWGGMRLGLLTHQPSGSHYDGVTTIRNGEQGAIVEDAHVGGSFDCGASVQYDFDLWGNKNYEADHPIQINIQNQWHIDDWPCFSKYFITFPLDQIPDHTEIISATLTMYHYGNSDPSNAKPSNIHLFYFDESWNDTTITWNNAPLAATNISRLRVSPLPSYPGWPGIPLTWDVSLALLEAIKNDKQLHLALYSSDYERHSGKYFFSSDSGDSEDSARPILTVYWINTKRIDKGIFYSERR